MHKHTIGDSVGNCPVHIWHGCYDESWKGLIVDEAFCHPAKFARGLIERIVRHGLDCGYWKAGDILGDPFAGVALGGIICGYHGLNWLGIELEEKFVRLGRQNLDLHREKIKALGYDVTLELRQGDSRQFAALVDGICTSPPYAEGMGHAKDGHGQQDVIEEGNRIQAAGGDRSKIAGYSGTGRNNYGSTPGQIGRLPAGSVDGVVTSPPYAESIKGEHGEKETAQESRAKRRTEGGSLGQSQRHGGYGNSEGNISNLKQGSLDGICTSPPFTTSQQEDGRTRDPSHAGLVNHRMAERTNPRHPGEKLYLKDYAPQNAIGNIANASGETYWQAMATVYGQCRQCLKPSGVMAVVVKDYVKNGQRVPLCNDTLKLLVSLGFEPIERIHAMLVKQWTEPHLFKGQVKKRKERKSFFRRLAESKGSPRIDYEEVLFVRAG